jgi:hypothetical protein
MVKLCDEKNLPLLMGLHLSLPGTSPDRRPDGIDQHSRMKRPLQYGDVAQSLREADIGRTTSGCEQHERKVRPRRLLGHPICKCPTIC